MEMNRTDQLNDLAALALGDDEFAIVHKSADLEPGCAVAVAAAGMTPQLGKWWPTTCGNTDFAEFIDPWRADRGLKPPQRLPSGLRVLRLHGLQRQLA